MKEKTKITKAIQVCYEVTSRNKEREINGILRAMEFFGLNEGFILTFQQEDEIIVEGRKILITPAWKYGY